MNWFSTSLVGHYPHPIKHKEVQEWGGCDHVVKDPSLLYAIRYEHDSFGKDGYCICEECYRLSEQARDSEMTSCNDCGNSYPLRALTAWVPYDYCPQDGDTATYVCSSCQLKERHRKRIYIDDYNRQREFGPDDVDD